MPNDGTGLSRRTRRCEYCGQAIRYPDIRRGSRNMARHFRWYHSELIIWDRHCFLALFNLAGFELQPLSRDELARFVKPKGISTPLKDSPLF